MQLQIIRSAEEFASLEQGWNQLLSNSASHVPFLRHEYLSAWWNTLGGGEWSQGDLFVVTARDESGELAGIAPLFFTQNREGEPALMFLGSIEISDYLDFIAPAERLPEFLDATLSLLSGPQAPDWKTIDLYNFVDSSASLPILQAAAQRCGWQFQLETLQHCPYIPLPGDWETYLAGIDKKQRHEIRRKLRRAENDARQVRWYIANDDSQLEYQIEAFLDLMGQDPEKASFLTEVMRSQMKATVLAACRAGWLQLSFLEVDGEKAAGYLNFDYQNRIWVYNSGLSQDFRDLSPGWVLLGRLLQWANEQGREAFDFMRGDEDYKYRFGGVDRFVMRARITRAG